MRLGAFVLAADMPEPTGCGPPSTPGGTPSRCCPSPASPTPAPRPRTPASSRSSAPAAAAGTQPTTAHVSWSPAPPDGSVNVPYSGIVHQEPGRAGFIDSLLRL